MKFATLPLTEAEGALLAHTLRLPGLVIAKGRRLDAQLLAQLRAAGVRTVAAARIEPGDAMENDAAERAARALAGDGVIAKAASAGRANLCAARRGLVTFEPQAVHALNGIDESITIATLALHDVVEAGEVVATIKVNPYAVPETIVTAWEGAAAAFGVLPFMPRQTSLIQTFDAALKDSVLKKALHATQERLKTLGGALAAEMRAPHEPHALAAAIAARIAAGDQLVLVCGACSTADRRDIVPSAIVEAGGRIAHFGMPVEPGNLLLLGAVGDIPVIGMPGCARTLQLNGFDHVLRRLLAGLPVGREEIVGMGVGGLLREQVSRPTSRALAHPRVASEAKPAPRISAIVMAAGRSSRMGANKLTLQLEGKAVLQHVLDAIRASGVASIFMVIGHDKDTMRERFAAPDITFVVNDDYLQGMSTSLRRGVAALSADTDAAMIFLGDMPDISAGLVDRMIATFDPAAMRAIVVPKRLGRQGHPVLWGREFFPALIERTSGDTGARHLIGEYAEWVAEIDVDHDGVLLDLDTPEQFAIRNAAKLCAE